MKKLSYRIECDEDPMSPRDWDNLGTMHCWHSRYNLGDEQHAKGTSEDFFFDTIESQLPDSYFEEWNGAYIDSEEHQNQIQKLFDKTFIYLPLYLYDHSGITINTRGFSCGWDSGQIGWIIVSKEKVREEYGWKNLTKKRIQEIEKYLRSEVETYDQYLTGDVWGYVIEDESGDTDYDSCWGFFGEDVCKQEAEGVLCAKIEYQKKHWKEHEPNTYAGSVHL